MRSYTLYDPARTVVIYWVLKKHNDALPINEEYFRKEILHSEKFYLRALEVRNSLEWLLKNNYIIAERANGTYKIKFVRGRLVDLILERGKMNYVRSHYEVFEIPVEVSICDFVPFKAKGRKLNYLILCVAEALRSGRKVEFSIDDYLIKFPSDWLENFNRRALRRFYSPIA